MSTINIADQVIETDVLIIGGGIGGPFAALFASEQGARVVLLEKADTRKSGSAGEGIGMWHHVLTDRLTLKDIAEHLCKFGQRLGGAYSSNFMPINKGLIDENLFYIGYRDNWEVIRTLEKWGLNMKWDDGQYRFEGNDNIRFHGRNIKSVIANKLQGSPVVVLERTMGIDLLTRDGTIAGATALNVRTGQFIVIKAKAVVLATGVVSRLFNPWHPASSGRFKMLYHYHAGSGDGIVMAFKAGAELVNLEISGIGAALKSTRLADKVPLCIHRSIAGTIYDAKGDKVIGGKADEPLSVEMQLNIEREGRGPCFTDVSHLPEEALKEIEWVSKDILPIYKKFGEERGLSLQQSKFEITHYKPEHNSVIAGVAYDENGQTAVERLYVVGDMTGGSTLLGSANAAVYGMRAGKHASNHVAKKGWVLIDENQVEECRETTFAPMKVKRGVEPLEVEVKIRDIVERYCGPERSEGMINQGLWRLRSVRDRFLPELMARDNHELMSAQEVRNLFLLAEVYLLCAKERKESGMRTFRLDHPEMANEPWKEAITARLENKNVELYHKKMPELRKEFKSKE